MDFSQAAETCCRQVCDAVGAYHNIAATLIIERALREAAQAERERCVAVVQNYAASDFCSIGDGEPGSLVNLIREPLSS